MRGCVIAVLLLIALQLGCSQQPIASAPAGVLPAVKIPVGPIPGPATANLNLPVNPYSQSQVAIMEGRRLFVWFNCAGCHGGHGGGGMGPSLRDVDWRYGSDDAHIFASIAEGRGQGMPAWGTRIPEDQIWKIVAYIKSMRTANEPDAPHMPPEPDTPVSSTEKTK